MAFFCTLFEILPFALNSHYNLELLEKEGLVLVSSLYSWKLFPACVSPRTYWMIPSGLVLLLTAQICLKMLFRMV